jgi:hypothetical protein
MRVERTRTGRRVLAAVALAALLVVLAVAACGSSSSGPDAMVGTWVNPKDSTQVLTISSTDGKYQVAVGTGHAELKFDAEERGSSLVIKDPTGESKEEISFTMNGDKLDMKSGTETLSLEKK